MEVEPIQACMAGSLNHTVEVLKRAPVGVAGEPLQGADLQRARPERPVTTDLCKPALQVVLDSIVLPR